MVTLLKLSQETTTDSQAIVVIALQEQAQRTSSTELRHQEEHGTPGTKTDPALELAVRTHRAGETITRSLPSLISKRTLQDAATFYQQHLQRIQSFLPN